MKIDSDLIVEIAGLMRAYDVAELWQALGETERASLYYATKSNPPEGVDVVEEAVQAYLALRPAEVQRFRKRIRDLTSERIVAPISSQQEETHV